MAAITLPTTFKVLKNLRANPDPFVWLIEITSPTGGALIGPAGERDAIVRLTGNSAPVEWRTTSNGQPLTWWPVRLRLSEIQMTLDGSLHGYEIRLSNLAGLAETWMLRNDDFLKHRVRLHLVNVATLHDPNAHRVFPGVVRAAAASLTEAVLAIAEEDYDFTVPKTIITDTCGRAYRKPGCDFALDQDGAILGPCSRLLTACRLRGALEEAQGVPVLHPRRFLGFLGAARSAASI